MPAWLHDLLPAGWTAWEVAVAATAFGVASALLSVFVVGAVLARIPADYFVNPAARLPIDRHPILKVLVVVGRNLLGYVLILLGVVLSLPGVPGQGILTILMGLMLIDLPGKDRAARWLVTRRPVLAAVNRMRAQVGREPLIISECGMRNAE
jgi:hypothetical protein